MTTRTGIITAAFLGLSSLFAGNAMAEHKPLRAGSGDARIRFDLGHRGGVSVSINNGHRHEAGRRWIPERYEERHVQVLVERGHYHEVHTQVLVHAGHYETRFVPPIYKRIVMRDGCVENVLVRAGYNERVWCPPKYEARCEKVWVPDRYETVCQKVLVPGRWEYVGGGHDHDHDHGNGRSARR